MRLLLLYPRLPYPPHKGDKIRTYHQFTYLTERHEVWCACFVDDRADWQHVQRCVHRCRGFAAIRLSSIAGLASGAVSMCAGRSVTEGFYQDRRMGDLVASWSADGKFDGVLCFGSGMAGYGLQARAGQRTLDLCDVDSAKWGDLAARRAGPGRWLYSREAERLARLECELAGEYDSVVLISEEERALLRNQAPHATTHVVGNGVDSCQGEVCGPPACDPVIAFVGAMDYWPNQDAVLRFANEVWPLLRERVPDAEWIIVGRNPSRRVCRLGDRAGITVTGSVPEVHSYLRGARVVIAPLRAARGVQNKVLEGMACGRPVVATSHAATGISAKGAPGLEVVDSPRDMVAALESLLTEPGRAEQAGAAARVWVAEHFDWNDRLARLDRILTGETEDGDVRSALLPAPSREAAMGVPA